jgi:hypothetical protein
VILPPTQVCSSVIAETASLSKHRKNSEFSILTNNS